MKFRIIEYPRQRILPEVEFDNIKDAKAKAEELNQDCDLSHAHVNPDGSRVITPGMKASGTRFFAVTVCKVK